MPRHAAPGGAGCKTAPESAGLALHGLNEQALLGEACRLRNLLLPLGLQSLLPLLDGCQHVLGGQREHRQHVVVRYPLKC